MELSAVWGALARRWYLVIVALALTVITAIVMMGRVGPSYTAQGTLLLFPPEGTTRAGERIEGNPYLSLGGLNPARDILIRAMTSKTSRTDLAESHPGVAYEMYADMAVSGPIVVVEVTGPSEKATIGALDDLFATVPKVLVDLQTDLGIKRREYITIQQLTIDETAQKVTKDQLRAGIVGGAGVLVAGLLGIGLLDGLLLSRGNGGRRPRESGPDETARFGRDPADRLDPVDRRDPVDRLDPVGPPERGRRLPARNGLAQVVPDDGQSSAARHG